MLCSAVRRETYIILSQAHSSVDLYSFCFENAEIVFTVRHVVEPGFSEAYRGGIVDDSHSQTTTSTCSASNSRWIYTMRTIRGLDRRPIIVLF